MDSAYLNGTNVDITFLAMTNPIQNTTLTANVHIGCLSDGGIITAQGTSRLDIYEI
jgi:hypothetical protein